MAAEINVENIEGGIKRTKTVREVDVKAQEMKDRLTLPAVPAFEMNDRQWEEYSRLLTPDTWTQVSSMYLYRIYPKIILQLVDPTNKYKNIDKLNRVGNIRDHIIKLHGGGKYRVDVSKNKKRGEEALCQVFIDIPISEVDPILDYRMLDLSASDNTGYITSLKARGILDDRGNPMQHNQPQQQAQQITGQDMIGMFREMMGLYQKMNTDQQMAMRDKLLADKEGGLGGAIGQLLLERMKQDSPGSLASSISSVLAVAKDITGPKNDNGNSDFIKMLIDQNKAMLEMQQKHSEAMITILKEKTEKPEPGEKILDSVDAAMSIMERLSSLQGGGGKRSGWDTGLEYAKELGLPIFNAISQIYTVYKMGKPMDATAAQPNPMARPTGKSISAMEAAANAARIAAGEKPAMYKGEPTNGVPEPQVEVLPNQVDPQLMGMLNMAAGPILKFMADDRSGADLALVLIEMYGKPSHAQLANYGEDKILEAAKSVPEFWANFAVYGEEKVKQFLNEFIHYEEYLEEEGNITEEEPKPNKKGGKK